MASETTTQHVAEGAAHATEKVGMPQLDFTSYPNQIFWLLITLIVIYLVLSRVAMPRIGSVLAERQGTISNDIAAAEDFKQRAVEAEAAYDKALADARVEAGRIIADAKADIQSELDVAISKADAQIAAKAAESETAILAIRASAAQSIKEVAVETAKDIVSKLGGKADAKTISAAVSDRLKG